MTAGLPDRPGPAWSHGRVAGHGSFAGWQNAGDGLWWPEIPHVPWDAYGYGNALLTPCRRAIVP